MRKGSTSYEACEVRCWGELFGNETPVSLHSQGKKKLPRFSICRIADTHGGLQGYLAHKKHPPPRTLQQDYLGSYGGPRGECCFL